MRMNNLIRMTALILMVSCSAFAQETTIQKADKLYADRDNVESLKQAVALIEKDVTNYDAMWRLAKFKFYLSNLESEEAQKIDVLQTGITAAERAIKIDTSRVEGHFWLGVTKGKYADLKGGFAAFGLIKTVR